MIRLRERQGFSDPGMAKLAELVRAVDPIDPARLPRKARRRSPRRVFWLLALSGGLAFAGVMNHHLAREPRVIQLQPAAPAPAIAPIVTPIAPPPVAPPPPIRPPSHPKHIDDGSALLTKSLLALRRDHDPELAGELVDRYLSRHAEGPLAEEALALGIEAADTRGDHATARALSTQYLERFPKGRFSEFAARSKAE